MFFSMEMQRYMVDGEMYVFPVVLRDEWANGFGPVIRTDLLEENGIATPTTWDEVLDALFFPGYARRSLSTTSRIP